MVLLYMVYYYIWYIYMMVYTINNPWCKKPYPAICAQLRQITIGQDDSSSS